MFFTSKKFGIVADVKEFTLTQLAEIYNEVTTNKPIKRFGDRPSALRRTRAAIEKHLESDEAPSVGKAAKKNKPEPTKPKPKPNPEPTKPKANKALISYPLGEEILHHRPNTRRGQLIRLMSQDKGVTLAEMMKETDWSEADVRVTLRMIHLHLGHGIQEDEQGNIQLLGRPRDRKPFNFSPAKEIKEHRLGTKRDRVIGMLSSKEGATMEEVRAETGWNAVQSFQGVILIHTYLGHGLSEDDEGRIRIAD